MRENHHVCDQIWRESEREGERETGMWFSEEMCGGIYTVKEGRLSRKE